ncbi:hypothetical protein K502DRAFT_167603 [Neoconidiobolus thromboides FSU 785]|nr:hypothetical protein K502DRAFT_167603 [Neoconidiobolus thromboides FSU 785]
MQDTNFANTKIGVVEPWIGVDIVLFVIAILSFALNTVIAYLTLFNRNKFLAIDSILISIIAILDSIGSLFLIITQIIKWSIGDEITTTSIFCNFSLLIFISATFISIIVTGILSLVRYLIIVKNYHISNKRFVIIITISLVLLYSIICVAAFTTNLILMPSGIYCLPGNRNTITIKFFNFMILFFVIPTVFLIPICYLLVLNHYRKLIDSLNTGIETIAYKKSIKKRFFDSTILKFLIVIIFYLICLCPEFILFLYTTFTQQPRLGLADGIVMLFLFSVTLVNGIFVVTLHEESKDSFLRFIGIKSNHTLNRSIDSNSINSYV